MPRPHGHAVTRPCRGRRPSRAARRARPSPRGAGLARGGAGDLGLLVVSAILSWVAFFQVGIGEGEAFTVPVLTFIHSGSLAADWALRIDTLTVVMLVVVNTVSSLVHIYSIGYMAHDPHRPRFFAYLSLFTFAMLMLVTADNLVQMFFGWEGVGLASYLLIGFWYHRPSANAAAIKAFIVNRVGDFGFALGIFGVFALFSSIDLDTIFANADAVAQAEEPVLNFLGYSLDGEARSPSSACSSSWARWASRRRCRCTPGCPTPWKARPRSPRSSTPRPW